MKEASMRTLTRFGLPFVLGMVVVLVFGNLASSQQRPRRQYIGPQTSSDQRAFSTAVLVGDTLYLSGRIAPATKAPGEGEMEKSIRSLLDGFVGVLKEAGMTVDDLVTVQIHTPDLTLYNQFNTIYKTYFKGSLPARAFIGSGPLLNQGHFEMLGVAVRQ
jgi:2-iminobutanoate/2-iminopropanoate deaminase